MTALEDKKTLTQSLHIMHIMFRNAKTMNFKLATIELKLVAKNKLSWHRYI